MSVVFFYKAMWHVIHINIRVSIGLMWLIYLFVSDMSYAQTFG